MSSSYCSVRARGETCCSSSRATIHTAVSKPSARWCRKRQLTSALRASSTHYSECYLCGTVVSGQPQAAEDTAIQATPIAVSDAALSHLKELKAKKGDERLTLRIGVRSGGCSGMSYVMEFESAEMVQSEDVVMEYEGFNLVCDPKSLLYLFGMKLDYSDALIDGGFKFSNPNAEDTCGCGKSFGV